MLDFLFYLNCIQIVMIFYLASKLRLNIWFFFNDIRDLTIEKVRDAVDYGWRCIFSNLQP